MNTQKPRRSKGIIGAIVLIIVGTAILLERNGILSHQVLSQAWPLLLVGVGAALLVRRLGQR